MRVAILYAAWSGDKDWSTPIAWQRELEFRGHEIRHYNLYHDPETARHKDGSHIYSTQGLNLLAKEYRSGVFKPDVIYLMDYGCFDSLNLSHETFPDVVLAAELGDCPQSYERHRSKFNHYDVFFSPDYICTELLKDAGLNAYWATHWADTKIFYPRTDIKPIFDCITTCGNRGGGITDKIQLALGDRFNNTRYYHGEEHAKRFLMGKIGFQCSQYREITRRIFEIAATGRMVLTDRLSPATHIEDLLEDKIDIVYYDDANDAIDKINYYASHDNEREEIAANGCAKVLAEHSVGARVDQWERVVQDYIMENNL